MALTLIVLAFFYTTGMLMYPPGKLLFSALHMNDTSLAQLINIGICILTVIFALVSIRKEKKAAAISALVTALVFLGFNLFTVIRFLAHNELSPDVQVFLVSSCLLIPLFYVAASAYQSSFLSKNGYLGSYRERSVLLVLAKEPPQKVILILSVILVLGSYCFLMEFTDLIIKGNREIDTVYGILLAVVTILLFIVGTCGVCFGKTRKLIVLISAVVTVLFLMFLLYKQQPEKMYNTMESVFLIAAAVVIVAIIICWFIKTKTYKSLYENKLHQKHKQPTLASYAASPYRNPQANATVDNTSVKMSYKEKRALEDEQKLTDALSKEMIRQDYDPDLAAMIDMLLEVAGGSSLTLPDHIMDNVDLVPTLHYMVQDAEKNGNTKRQIEINGLLATMGDLNAAQWLLDMKDFGAQNVVDRTS